MSTTFMIIHGIISVLLIASVLLQFGKGAEAGLLSGAGGESVMSGSQKEYPFKNNVGFGVLFMLNSIFLAKLQSQKSSSSLLDGEAPVARPLNNDAAEESAPKTKEAPAKETSEKK